MQHGTVSDADTIRDTAVAQPLIVAAGLLTAAALKSRMREGRLAGSPGTRSGEITAAAISGILSDEDALRFVRERSTQMARAAARRRPGCPP